MDRFLAVGIGGGLGSCARYALGVWMLHRFGTAFPAATLVVNVLGSFLIAAVMQLGAQTQLLPPLLGLALSTGFLGGFTTFSAFSYETLALVRQAGKGMAVLNVTANVVGALAGCWAGFRVAHALMAR